MSEDLIRYVPYSEIEKMGEAIAKSNLFGMKTKEQAIALMLIAQAEGRHPALAAKDYDIIQGKPCKKAEAMLRDFIDLGGKVEWHTLTDEEASATFSHVQGGTMRITWTIDMAKDADLAGKDNWKKFPRAMLRSRCVSEGLKTVCPGASSQMYTPEEVQDFKPESPKIIHKIGDNIDQEAVNMKTGEIIEAESEEVREEAPPAPTEDGDVDQSEVLKSELRRAIHEVVAKDPTKTTDSAFAFFIGNQKAKFEHIDIANLPGQIEKLKIALRKAKGWLKAFTLTHGGSV